MKDNYLTIQLEFGNNLIFGRKDGELYLYDIEIENDEIKKKIDYVVSSFNSFFLNTSYCFDFKGPRDQKMIDNMLDCVNDIKVYLEKNKGDYDYVVDDATIPLKNFYNNFGKKYDNYPLGDDYSKRYVMIHLQYNNDLLFEYDDNGADFFEYKIKDKELITLIEYVKDEWDKTQDLNNFEFKGFSDKRIINKMIDNIKLIKDNLKAYIPSEEKIKDEATPILETLLNEFDWKNYSLEHRVYK